MSIINDALKKAQKNIPSSRSTPESDCTPKPKSLGLSTSAPKPQASRRPSAVRVWIVIVSLGLLWIALIITRKPLSPNLTSDDTAPSSSKPEAIATDSTEAPGPTPDLKAEPLIQDIEQTIRLNGTLMMNDKRVALINNNIYETGEMVDGYQLIDITLQGIQLEKDGERFTVRVKNTKADRGDF